METKSLNKVKEKLENETDVNEERNTDKLFKLNTSKMEIMFSISWTEHMQMALLGTRRVVILDVTHILTSSHVTRPYKEDRSGQLGGTRWSTSALPS